MQFLLLISLVSATSCALAHESNSHHVKRGLPESTWYQERDNSVHSLFRRLPKLSGVTFPDIGSDEWKEGFPPANPDAADIPEAWSSRLDAAVKDGKIPDIPQTTQTGDADPAYPKSVDPYSPEVCSSTYKCRAPGSIWDGPSGYFGVSFDDGPLPFSDALLDFMKNKGEKGTHFMIGQNILENPDQFKKAFNQGHDIAVHTWTHRYMTTLSNEDVVAELGWTMQIIHNSTGGLVPKFWRPPFGDSDVRVQAIAKEVFGLKTVLWNKDSNDWGIAEGVQKKADVSNAMSKFLKTSKSKGLIVLEHESSKQAVDMFISSYDSIKANGWKTKSLARLIDDKNPYQNLNGDDISEDERFLDHGEDDGEDEGDDDGGEDDDNGDVDVLATGVTSADDPEETLDNSDDSGSSDDDSSSSDGDSSSSDDDEASSGDDSSSSDDTSSDDSTDDATSTDDDTSSTDDDKSSKKKDNGALSTIAGMMSGSLLIVLCVSPAAFLLLA